MSLAKRVIVFLVVAFFLFYLISQPEQAAAVVSTVFAALGVAFNSIIRFFRSLAS
jgi:hypothetical protein